MIVDFANFMARGYLAPRATLRQLLNGGHGFDVALLLIALGYVLESVLVKFLVSRPGAGEVSLVAFHMLNMTATVCGFLILSGLVFWAGRIMGGIATLAQTQLAVAWFMLVTSLLSPFAMMGLPDQFFNPSAEPGTPIDMSSANTTLIFLVAGAVIWLLSSTVAEAHGFRSVWRVAAVIMAIPIGVLLLLSMLGGG